MGVGVGVWQLGYVPMSPAGHVGLGVGVPGVGLGVAPTGVAVATGVAVGLPEGVGVGVVPGEEPTLGGVGDPGTLVGAAVGGAELPPPPPPPQPATSAIQAKTIKYRRMCTSIVLEGRTAARGANGRLR